MSRVSFSAADRFMACPPSPALPAVSTPPGDDAVWGTGVHAFARDSAVLGYDIALARVPVDVPWRATCEGLELWPLWEGEEIVRAEWSIAINHLTGEARALGCDLDRAYRLPEPWICGTVDLYTEDADGARVVDYKTGHEPPAARTSGQLAIAALAVARLRGLSEVTVGIVHIREDGSHTLDQHTYDLPALALVEQRLRNAWSALERAREFVSAGRTPDVSAGPWCRYCPALAACPSVTSLARGLLSPGPSLAERVAALSAIDAGELWVRLDSIERLASQAKEALKTRVWAEGSLPLPDGSAVVPVEATYESISAREAAPVLLAHGISLSDVSEPRVTKAGIEKAVKAKGGGKQEVKALLDALRASGAVKRKDQVSYRTRKKEEAA